METALSNLRSNLTRGAQVTRIEEHGWRLEIPAGPQGNYRLSQLDDYTRLARRAFPWHPPLIMRLRARASAADLPGTWGFGLWNDPFSLSLGLGGASQRLPALPNAAWFFFASPPNYLSFRDDLPAQGFLAATFRSLALPAPLLALGSPILTLAVLPPTVRLLRLLLRQFISQDAACLTTDVTAWHTYTLEWRADRLLLSVDGAVVLDTQVAPRGPLSLVLWIDNQYAALPPRGRLRYGNLPNPEPAWIEIADFDIQPQVAEVEIE